MTNDTNTLNGALRELGETMAANLTTQGVASTWDEGLTTLAGKILDITPGPGPTPSFDGISLTGNKNILSAADSEYVTLEAQLTDSGSAAAVSGETVTFTVYKDSDDSVVTTLTDDTDSTGLATVSYYGEGAGDLYIKSNVDSIISSEIYVVDAYKYTADGSGLDGTFTVADGYITGCQSNTGITSFDLTGDFEMSFQHYINATSVSSPDYNALWNIGQDSNNGALIGVEGADKRIRIYNRSNASNTSVQVQTNAYNTKTWNTFIIRYVNGVWSITSGVYTLSYSKSFTPAFIRLNSNFTSTRLKEFMIKPL